LHLIVFVTFAFALQFFCEICLIFVVIFVVVFDGIGIIFIIVIVENISTPVVASGFPDFPGSFQFI